jgi:hypothetical protein
MLGVDVCVKPLNESGFCHIDGQITGGGGGNIFFAPPNEAVSVYAVSNTTGEIVGYDITEGDGYYSLDNLPAGSYTIVVDKEGFTASNSPSVTVDDGNGFTSSGNSVGVTGDPPLGIGDRSYDVPGVFMLGQNYPNPFNPTTDIRYDVAEAVHVTIRIFNVLGQVVTTLTDQQMQPGSYLARWNGKDRQGLAVNSGVYFYKMEAGRFSEVKKLMLMR